MRSFRLFASVLTVLSLLTVAGSAHAERHEWPGKLQLGLRPLGGQVALENNPTAIYLSNIDLAGRIYENQAISLWLGGEIGIGGREHLAVIEPGLFVRATFEKLLSIPLVPFVQVGATGGAYVSYINDQSMVVGSVGGKVGGGVDYYVTKRIALGVQTDFSFGAAIASDHGQTQTQFTGAWDVLGGVRFAL